MTTAAVKLSKCRIKLAAKSFKLLAVNLIYTYMYVYKKHVSNALAHRDCMKIDCTPSYRIVELVFV